MCSNSSKQCLVSFGLELDLPHADPLVEKEGNLSIHGFKHAELQNDTCITQAPEVYTFPNDVHPQCGCAERWEYHTFFWFAKHFQTCTTPSVPPINQYYRLIFGVPCGNHMMAMGDSIEMEFSNGKTIYRWWIFRCHVRAYRWKTEPVFYHFFKRRLLGGFGGRFWGGVITSCGLRCQS